MTSQPVLAQRLRLLKQHHDELATFFTQIEQEVDLAYRRYKVTDAAMDIVADVITSLVLLADAGYRIVVLAETDPSKAGFAIAALKFG